MQKTPLRGITVLDLTGLLPGPLATMYLGDLGAEVIKIENPRAWDGTRKMSGSSSMSHIYQVLNRNKKAVTLNLRRPKGREIFMKLAANADIVVEGFRPGAMKSMGLDPEDLCRENPRLIYCSIIGYASGGKWANHAGHDANYLARAGILSQIADENGRPVLPGVQIADVGGGSLVSVSAVLAALFVREREGYGQRIEVSMAENAAMFAALLIGDCLDHGKDPVPGKWLLSGGYPNYRVYETLDHQYVVVAALEPMFFRNFLRKIGRMDLVSMLDYSDSTHYEDIQRELNREISSRDYAYWSSFFEEPDLCFCGVATLKDLLDDPYYRSVGTLFEMDLPDGSKSLQIGSPFRFSKSEIEYRFPPPKPGEHNREIYARIGCRETDLQKWERERVI